MTHPMHEDKTPKQFWEERYAESVSRKRGNPGTLLQHLVREMPAQRALELGCGTGDDTLWLAENGWQVTAVDISAQSIAITRRLALEAGLDGQIRLHNCDLTTDFPAGQFELVTAQFFQSPYPDFPRIQILQTAASRIVPGGHLLITTHATAPSWRKHAGPLPEFPTAEADWQDLALTKTQWELVNLGQEPRTATGPEGQQEEILDNLILARRLSSI